MQENGVQSLVWEYPLEKGTATHSSILAWRIPWTVAHQVPLSMGFSRQDYWRGLPCPLLGHLSDPEIEPLCLVSCVGRWVLYLQCHLGSRKSASLEENSVSTVGEKRARETLYLSHDV